MVSVTFHRYFVSLSVVLDMPLMVVVVFVSVS